MGADAALDRAEQADRALARGVVWGLFHGVPITIKDCFETAGMRTTCGFKVLSEHVPSADATVVSRLSHAGAIVLGKTNVPPLAADYQTDNPVFGRSNNPWDTTRTPGGSSGGSAAAVAAGLSALDIGSDLGGSIRVPAHFCGVYGFKPTEHRVSSVGHLPDADLPGLSGVRASLRHQGVYGPLARSIRDLRLALQVIEGPDPRAPSVPPVNSIEHAEVRPRQLRLAWTDRLGDVAVSGETASALANFVGRLDSAGVEVHRAAPTDWDLDEVWETWGEIAGAEIGVACPPLVRALLRLDLWRSPDRSVMRYGLLRGLRLNLRRYMAALARRDRLISALESFLGEWDCWLCPVTAGPAFSHRKSGSAIEVDGRPVDYLNAVAAYTTPFNMSGNPVLVVPIAKSSNGLPIGVQVVTRRWADDSLLAIGELLDAESTGFSVPAPLMEATDD
jgi:amidase